VAVICQLLGVPLEDEPQFSQATDLLAQHWTRSSDHWLNAQRFRGAALTEEACRLLEGHSVEPRIFPRPVEQRRSRPGDDFISGLIAVEESGIS
jgi:cytochrome P450